MDNNRFGDRLRELRLTNGMSQRSLARNLGVSFTYISKLERVRRQPSQKLIGKLAEALGADEDDLLTLAGKVPPDIVEMLRDPELLGLLRSLQANRRLRAASR